MADEETTKTKEFNLEVEVDWRENNFFDQLTKINHKLEQIIDLLETRTKPEAAAIDSLEPKMELERPQPPIDCECSVSGTAQGNVNPALMGELSIDIYPDCTIEDSFFNYQVFNPAEQPIRQGIGVTFTEVESILNGSGEGTVNISGTALVKTSVDSPFRTESFTLDLKISDFKVTSFTIKAGNISDTVNLAEGNITVNNYKEKN